MPAKGYPPVATVMSRALKIRLANPNLDLVHAFRNFGEDVFRELREAYRVSIEEIDASTEEFHVRGIPRREVRRAGARIRKLSDPHRNLIIELEELIE